MKNDFDYKNDLKIINFRIRNKRNKSIKNIFIFKKNCTRFNLVSFYVLKIFVAS